MIATTFYSGQGLGNQLWAYSVVRSLAKARGYQFGYLGLDRFKGNFFGLDLGISLEQNAPRTPREWTPSGFKRYVREHSERLPDGTDVSKCDPRLFEILPATLLDGNFQSEKYFHDSSQVKSWFQLGAAKRDVCVLNIRGGEYRGIREVFLPKIYFQRAMAIVRNHIPGLEFEIVTDDLALAKEWFPEIPAYSSGGVKRYVGGIYLHPSKDLVRRDFERVQSARAVILSNSSFSWWGAFTNPNLSLAIAPKYWARHNVSEGYWSTGDSLTKGWLYLDRQGRLFSYEECLSEITG